MFQYDFLKFFEQVDGRVRDCGGSDKQSRKQLTQFARIVFRRNSTPENIEHEAGIVAELLGYSKRG